MQALTQQRCYRHHHREAVARCLSCGRYFCRECVTEHQGRLLCSTCLSKQPETSLPARAKFAVLFHFLQFGFGGLIIWLAFYLVGYLLLSIPTDFHEGTIWKKTL